MNLSELVYVCRWSEGGGYGDIVTYKGVIEGVLLKIEDDFVVSSIPIPPLSTEHTALKT